MLGLLRRIRNIMTVRTARTIANRISHCAPGPMPKTMGMGPMKMIPPELVEPPWETVVAIVTSIRPTSVVENPRMKRARSFRGEFSSAGSAVSGICAAAPGLFVQEIQDYDQCCEK